MAGAHEAKVCLYDESGDTLLAEPRLDTMLETAGDPMWLVPEIASGNRASRDRIDQSTVIPTKDQLECHHCDDETDHRFNTSIAGLYGFAELSTYCTSKGAVRNLTRQLAVEQGPNGIRVNAVNPGVIETAMSLEDSPLVGALINDVLLGRDGQPEEVASVMAFLASDDLVRDGAQPRR